MQQATQSISRDLADPRRAVVFAFLAAGIAVALALVSYSTLRALVNIWNTQQEYSYGYLIPFVFLFLLYQRLDRISTQPLDGSWAGTAMVAAGLLLEALGRISTLDTVAQYGFLLVVWGLALSYLGWRAFRVALVPFAVLAFMMPIPNYLLRELSQTLQLVSSRLGVEMIRWCGISVYLEGNVIDLGVMKLQVIEACSGLRYMFSLMVLGFLVAYLYQDRLWKRVLVWLSTIPITVLMNSARIALVGVTVDRWGREAANGLLHDFEGVSVFLGCMAILLIEIWLLLRLTRDPRALRAAMALELPPLNMQHVKALLRWPSGASWTAVALVALAAAMTIALPERTYAKPERGSFGSFPLQVADWQGAPDRLEQDVLEMLKLDDYLLVNYSNSQGAGVNLYAVYYAAQTDGNSAHSPRACLPGNGWEIQQFGSRRLDTVLVGGRALDVNRVVMQKGDNRALVYYWFQQRGRFDTDEYVVKLHIFADSLSRGRTDGAMVRLVTGLGAREDVTAADARLQAFAVSAVPELRRYVPE
jgi:exosortase D (VPLPA-CTERM-specific)